MALVALVGLVLMLVATDRAIRDQVFGVQLVLVVAFLNHAVSLPRIVLSGVQVDARDLLFTVLMASIAARACRGWRPSGMETGMVAVAGFVLFSLGRGVMAFGLTTAINETRVHLYFMAMILYMLSSPDKHDRRAELTRLWLLYASALMALALFRWAIVFGDLPGLGGWYDPAYGGLRVIKSDETMVVGTAFLILLPALVRGEATRWQTRLTATFGIGVLLLQHRSVIAMLLLGALVQLVRNRRMMATKVALGLGVLALTGAFAFLSLDDGSVTEEVRTTEVAGTGTFEWRVEGWAVLVADYRDGGPLVIATGQPFGLGWDRRMPSGQIVTVSPHNMYVEYLVRIGALGIGTFVWVLFALWARLRRNLPQRGSPLLDDSTLSVLIIAFATYMIPYRLFLETGVLLGVAVTTVVRRRRVAPEPAAASPPGGVGPPVAPRPPAP
ncbi:hypothetical protein BH23ACT9_BH23ACT9_39280 [soil metagenome]